MQQKLPVEIEPLRLARQKQTLAGVLNIAALKRLCLDLADDAGEVNVQLEFGFDASNKPYVVGQFNAEVVLTCERCMEAMPFHIQVNNMMGIVKHEHQIDDIPESYEPWLIGEDGPVFLADMIEEELILALPLVAKHESACIPAEAWQTAAVAEIEDEGARESSPFDVLASLKSK